MWVSFSKYFVEMKNKNPSEYQTMSLLPNQSVLMTETELIQFLRIPEISDSKDYHNVIEHLKRYRDLPRIHICNKILFPKNAILKWIEKETSNGK